MTVIGVSGCTALLLVGFGPHDAIWDIIDNQFGPIIHYNTTVTLTDNADEKDAALVDDLLGGQGASSSSRVPASLTCALARMPPTTVCAAGDS